MDIGAWWDIVYGVEKSQTRLNLHAHAHTHTQCLEPNYHNNVLFLMFQS